MNTNKNVILPNEMGESFSFIRMLVIYLVICGIGVGVLLFSFSDLIRSNNKELTGDICSLVTEKVNNSISYMTSSAEDMAQVMSAQNYYDIQELYDTMLQGSSGSRYVSIGFIDEEGVIYASETELDEFEKWQLTDTAELANPVSISAPYRSAQIGQPVFTMFVKFTYGGGKNGSLFLTYPLKEIENMASTEYLTDDAEIWLMEAASDNIIQCAGPNVYSIGVWDNALVSLRKPINDKYQDDYAAWKDKMNSGEETAAITYKIGRETYTQVYSKINSMYGWYVVVRIPSKSLSLAIQQFRTSVIMFMCMLLVATIIMFIVSHQCEAREKNALENLSVQDPLTSALNRHAFDYTAEQYMGYLGNALKNEAVLLSMDIDFFRHVNDRFGHEAGDRILTGFSAALREIFGNDGYVSRYGGDEFAVLVCNGDKEKIIRQLELLQKKVAALRPCNDETECADFTLTFSCGAAVFPTDADDLKELQADADNALCIVKEKGGNGYRWYEKWK